MLSERPPRPTRGRAGGRLISALLVIVRMRRLLKKTGVVTVPLALNDLVASTIALVANDAMLQAVAIQFSPAPDLPVAYGDSVQVQQVIA